MSQNQAAASNVTQPPAPQAPAPPATPQAPQVKTEQKENTPAPSMAAQPGQGPESGQEMSSRDSEALAKKVAKLLQSSGQFIKTKKEDVQKNQLAAIAASVIGGKLLFQMKYNDKENMLSLECRNAGQEAKAISNLFKDSRALIRKAGRGRGRGRRRIGRRAAPRTASVGVRGRSASASRGMGRKSANRSKSRSVRAIRGKGRGRGRGRRGRGRSAKNASRNNEQN